MNKYFTIVPACILHVCAFLVLAGATPVFALSTISISSVVDGVFAVQGTGIENASAMEINILYDTRTLINPRVTEGPFISGSMVAINPNVPGIIRIVLIRITPMSGNGLIATLSFTRTGSSAGRINSISAKLANANGAPLTSQVQIINPTETTTSSSAAEQNQPSSSGAGSVAVPPPVVQPIIIAGEPPRLEDAKKTQDTQNSGDQDTRLTESDRSTEKQADQQSSEQTPTTPQESIATSGTATPKRGEERKTFTLKGILDRFKEYAGPRNADAFIALFNNESLIGFRQSPEVALADGQSIVTVTFLARPGTLTTANVAAVAATLLSLNSDPDNTNTWIARILPTKDVYQAAIAVSQNDVKIVYPVSVAPKIAFKRDRTGRVPKALIDRYLTSIQSGATPSPDVSGDGKWDYRDDYILTANYLSVAEKPPR